MCGLWKNSLENEMSISTWIFFGMTARMQYRKRGKQEACCIFFYILVTIISIDLAPWNRRAHSMTAVCFFSVCIPDPLHSLFKEPCRSVCMFLSFNILTTAQSVLLYPPLHFFLLSFCSPPRFPSHPRFMWPSKHLSIGLIYSLSFSSLTYRNDLNSNRIFFNGAK